MFVESRSEKAILQRRNPNVLLYGCVCLSDRRLPNLLNATVVDETHSPLVHSTVGVKESCSTSMILLPCALLIHNFSSISSMLCTKPQHGTWSQSIKYPSYIDDNNANLRAYWRLCGKTDTKHLVNIIFVDVNALASHISSGIAQNRNWCLVRLPTHGLLSVLPRSEL